MLNIGARAEVPDLRANAFEGPSVRIGIFPLGQVWLVHLPNGRQRAHTTHADALADAELEARQLRLDGYAVELLAQYYPAAAPAHFVLLQL
jgi:hypothetical protein